MELGSARLDLAASEARLLFTGGAAVDVVVPGFGDLVGML